MPIRQHHTQRRVSVRLGIGANKALEELLRMDVGSNPTQHINEALTAWHGLRAQRLQAPPAQIPPKPPEPKPLSRRYSWEK